MSQQNPEVDPGGEPIETSDSSFSAQEKTASDPEMDNLGAALGGISLSSNRANEVEQPVVEPIINGPNIEDTIELLSDPHWGSKLGRADLRCATLVFFDFEQTANFKRFMGKLNWNLKKACDHKSFLNEVKECAIAVAANSCWLPRIGDLSFIAVPRQRYMFLAKAAQLKHKRGEVSLSISNDVFSQLRKITLPVNIEISDYDMEVYWENTNSPLQYAKKFRRWIERYYPTGTSHLPFRYIWDKVFNFLDGLPKPIMLVGHNGLSHDLTGLFAELYRNVLTNKFPKQVYLADSLFGIMYLEQTRISADLLTWPTGSTAAILRRYGARDGPNGRRSLISQGENGKWTIQLNNYGYPSTPGIYSLHKVDNEGRKGLYVDIVKGDETAFHTAEADARALLEVCTAYDVHLLQRLELTSVSLDFISTFQHPFPLLAFLSSLIILTNIVYCC